MPRVIEIPEYGEVEFPDTMSDADVNDAAKRLHQAKTGQMADIPRPPAMVKPPAGMWDQAKAAATRTLGNVIPNLGQVGENIYNLGKLGVQAAQFTVAPYTTPNPLEGVATLARGTMQSMIPFFPPNTPEQKAAEETWQRGKQAVSEFAQHPMQSVGEYVQTRPVEALMDIATLGKGGGKALEAIPALNKAGKAVYKASELLDPVQQSMRLTGSLTRGAIEPALTAMGRKQYQRALNPSGNLYENYWASKAGVEAGIPLSAAPEVLHGDIVGGKWKVVERAKALKKAADVKINATLDDLTKQGFIGDKDQLADSAFAYLADKYKNSDTAMQDIEKMKEMTAQYKAGGVYDPKSGGYIATSQLTPKQMSEQKYILQNKAMSAYDSEKLLAADPMKSNFQKAVAFELRKQLEDWAPELKTLNESSRDFKLLTQELEKFVNQRLTRPKQTPTQLAWAGGRVVGAGGLGFLAAGPAGGATGVLAAIALGSPPIRSRIAIMLNRAGKLAEAGGTALVNTAPILPITPATQALSHLSPMPAPPPSLSEQR